MSLSIGGPNTLYFSAKALVNESTETQHIVFRGSKDMPVFIARQESTTALMFLCINHLGDIRPPVEPKFRESLKTQHVVSSCSHLLHAAEMVI